MQTFHAIWDRLSWKKSALVRSKILGLFANTFTAEYTYSRRNMQTFTQKVHTPLSWKQKTFSGFFIASLKSTWNGEHFEKKGESSSLSISEIIDSKRGGYLSAWRALPAEELSVINLLTGRQTPLKSARHYYYPIFPWIWDKLSWKKSALVRSKILGLFVNTLTAEYTYSRRNMQTFTQKVQFSSHYADFHATSSDAIIFKTKDFLWIFYCRFWNLHEMENNFEKKGESSSLSISEIIDYKRGGYLSAWRALPQKSFR